MAEVTLQNISKIYRDTDKRQKLKKTIDDISFTVLDKEFMVLVGPSGCGKSTLLRMIAGLEDITDGVVAIDGVTVNGLDPRSRDIAMVFQNYALYPHMTVYENMAFGLKLKNFSKQEIKKRVLETAELLELGDELFRKPKSLSGGQRQRVAIGRAIIRRPKVFLFDEPLSNLDAKLRVQMRIELQKLHREIAATMIYVTHDQTEAMTLGNRIAVMNKGRLMQLDTPLNLYNHPSNRFVAGFIGSPAMNFMNGSISRDDDEYFFLAQSGSCRVALGNVLPPGVGDHKRIQIGIRPEHILTCQTNRTESAPSGESRVIAYENMGSEQLLYLSVGDETLVARVAAAEIVEPGSQLAFRFMKEKIFYIDQETGEVVNRMMRDVNRDN